MDNPSRALRQRFWPRLSIRGLMILVLVLGGGIGWVARHAKMQRNAVRGVSAAGGVRYNWQYVSGKYEPKASPPGPMWLRDIVGPDLLDTVVVVWLRGPDADYRVMSHVVALPGVERFNLAGQTSPSLTAAGMARIGQLPRLQRILAQGMTDSSGFLPRSVGDAGRRRGYEGTCWAFGPANTQSEGNPGIGGRCRLLADAIAWITDFTLSPESAVARFSLMLGGGLSASIVRRRVLRLRAATPRSFSR
jgi:hypothetical protein